MTYFPGGIDLLDVPRGLVHRVFIDDHELVLCVGLFEYDLHSVCVWGVLWRGIVSVVSFMQKERAPTTPP